MSYIKQNFEDGHEPVRCLWQMKHRRSVCRGRPSTQSFATRRGSGTANG